MLLTAKRLSTEMHRAHAYTKEGKVSLWKQEKEFWMQVSWETKVEIKKQNKPRLVVFATLAG